MANKTDEEIIQGRVAAAEAEYPGRGAKPVDYGGRILISLRPTSGQAAALARLGKSGRMEEAQRVANFLDILELLLADQDDRDWLSGGMLGGSIDIGDADDDDTKPPSALGLLRALTRAHAAETNREGRRAAAPPKKARRVTG